MLGVVPGDTDGTVHAALLEYLQPPPVESRANAEALPISTNTAEVEDSVPGRQRKGKPEYGEAEVLPCETAFGHVDERKANDLLCGGGVSDEADRRVIGVESSTKPIGLGAGLSSEAARPKASNRRLISRSHPTNPNVYVLRHGKRRMLNGERRTHRRGLGADGGTVYERTGPP